MAQHTPGPWHRNIKPASKYPTVWSGRNTHVAAICAGAPRGSGDGNTMSEEEQEANISLIAAAPDMLAALKLVSSLDIFHDALRIVDAAIAKAEGR